MEKSIGLPPLDLAEKSPAAKHTDARPTDRNAVKAFLNLYKKLFLTLGFAILVLVVVAVYFKVFVEDKDNPERILTTETREINGSSEMDVDGYYDIISEIEKDKEADISSDNVTSEIEKEKEVDKSPKVRSKRQTVYYPELVKRHQPICKENPRYCKNIRYYQRHSNKESIDPINVNHGNLNANFEKLRTGFDHRHHPSTNKVKLEKSLQVNKQEYNNVEFNRKYLYCEDLNCHEFSLSNSPINKALLSGNYRFVQLTEALTKERNIIYLSYKDKCTVDRLNQFCDSLSHELQKMDTVIMIITNNNKTGKRYVTEESFADVTQNKQIICLGTGCDPTVIDISSIAINQNSNDLNLVHLVHYLQIERNKLLSVYHIDCSTHKKSLCQSFSMYLARLESLIALFKQPNPTLKLWQIRDKDDEGEVQNSLSSEKFKKEAGSLPPEPCKLCFDTLTDEKMNHFEKNNISSVLASLRNNRDRLLPTYMNDCVPSVNNSICQTSLQHLIQINTLINEILSSNIVPKPKNQAQTEKSISFENGNLLVKEAKDVLRPFKEDDKHITHVKNKQKEPKNKNDIPSDAHLVVSEYALPIDRLKQIQTGNEINSIKPNKVRENPKMSGYGYQPRDIDYTHKEIHESQRIVASNEDRSIHGKGTDAEFHVPSVESVKTSSQSGFSSSGVASGYPNPICFYPQSIAERSNTGVLFPFTSPDAPLVNAEGISPRANDQFTGYGNVVPTMILPQQPYFYPYSGIKSYYPTMHPQYAPQYFNPYYTQRLPYAQYGGNPVTGSMLCSFINQQNVGETQPLTRTPQTAVAGKQQNLDLSVHYRNSQ